jgi:hypothetical protein
MQDGAMLPMFKTTCECCGARVYFPYTMDKFKICGRCLKVQKQLKVPIAELIARNLSANKEGKNRPKDRIGDFVVILVVLGGVCWFFWPHLFRVPGIQVPVAANVSSSFLIGNVLRIQNNSREPLTDVVVRVRSPQTNGQQGIRVGNIAPGEVKEVGTIDWGWVIEKGESITISSGDYLPIVFTAEQLGVK